eukprot:2523220-Amphidinium_carterae.1
MAVSALGDSCMAWRALWQLYIDDVDLVELKLKGEHAVIAPQWQDDLRTRYHLWSAARSENKAGEREASAKRLGYWVDGEAGKLGIDGERAGRLLGLTLYMVQQTRLSKRDLQILSGLWAHAIQFRREVSTVLQKWWQLTTHWGPGYGALSSAMVCEMCTLLLHLPLLQIDLRSPLPPTLLATDASSHGGGVCEGVGLTPEGRHQLLNEVQGFVGLGRDRLCLIMAGDELGQVRRALELLGIDTALCMAWPYTHWGAQILQHAWPDTLV